MTQESLATPVAPTAATTLRPIGVDSARLADSVWARWQQANTEVTIPHALEWLERDGSVDNLRRLAPGATGFGERRGLWFSDSDLYKVVEGIGWDLGRAPSDLGPVVDDLIEIIRAAQLDDGYLNSYVQAGLAERYGDLQRSHELYCLGHLIQAGIAHHRSTGSRSLLDVAIAAADGIVRDFGDGRRSQSDGHEEIEMALVELYRLTGTRAYLDTAKQFVDGRGHDMFPPASDAHIDPEYLQDATPVRAETTAVGHAVRAVYLMAGAVDVAVETGDDDLLAAVIRQWESMTSSKMYLTGALGSRHVGEAFGQPYELPQDIGYGETCATIGNIMLSWRLLLATGEARFADVIERSLYNLFAASTSLDRTGFFYSNPGHRRTALPAAPTDRRPDRADAPGTRPLWFACACCPPNIVRTVAALGTLALTHDDAGVQLQQYFAGSFALDAAAGRIALDVQTRYPDDGRVEVRLTETPSREWTLSLRVPPWARGASVTVNGVEVDAAVRDGFLAVTRAWSVGDTILLDLPVAPRLTVGHPAIDAVRGTVAIERGPVVFALENHDQDDAVDLETVRLDVSAPIREDWGAVAGQPTIVLRARGVQTDAAGLASGAWMPRDDALDPSGREVELTFIPYALWANRGPSTMRIHVPELTPGR